MSVCRVISEELFNQVVESAGRSTRKRANYNFHEFSDVYQRFLNVLLKGTYIRPHKHKNPPKPETFIALKGEFAFFLFDNSGNIVEKYLVASKGPIFGVDIPPNVWHSAVCLSDVCVCFEGKSGPYDPKEDKTFASWAPEENDPGALQYMNHLIDLLNLESNSK